MGHIASDPSRLLGRVRRIKGQVEGLEKAVVSATDCAEVMRQIAAVRGAINGLMVKVVEEHIEMHVAHPDIVDQATRARGAQELIDVLRTYLK